MTTTLQQLGIDRMTIAERMALALGKDNFPCGVLGATHTTRKPMLLLRLPGSFLLRLAER